MGIIVESDQEAATNADILSGTRLATAPANGVMLFEMQASDADAANKYDVSIQMPGGDNPLSSVLVPCGNSTGLAGVIDERTKLAIQVPVQQGGQVLFSCVETGDAELTWRVSFRY